MLDQLVEIHAEQFKGQAKMLLVNEGILQSEQVMVVIFVVLAIELCDLNISRNSK